MYLGQESWGAQGGKGQAAWGGQQGMMQQQQMQQQTMQGQGMRVAPPAQGQGVRVVPPTMGMGGGGMGGGGMGGGGGGGGGVEVGDATKFNISGCTHQVVGPIVRGSYSVSGMNHGKPAYKRDTQVNGLSVMIYFYDERDGPAASGWWLGPTIGGNEVWGYNPNKTTKTLPLQGWQVPHSGGVDPTFLVSPVRTGSMTVAPPGGKGCGGGGGCGGGCSSGCGGGCMGKDGWGKGKDGSMGKGGWGGAPAADKGWGGKGQSQWPAIANGQPQPQVVNPALAQQQMAAKRAKEEEAKKAKEAEIKKKADEAKALVAANKAAGIIRSVIARVKTATPETIETLEKQLEAILAKELEACGVNKAAVQQESFKGLEAGKANVEKVKEQREKNAQKQAELAKQREEAAAKAQELLKELEGLVETAEASSKELEEAYAPLEKASEQKAVDKAADAVKTASEEVTENVKACTDFITSKRGEMKDQPQMKAPVKTGEQSAAPAEEKLSLTKLEKRVNACTQVARTRLLQCESKKNIAAKKTIASDAMKKKKTAVTKYDKDKDGFLSKAEIKQYAKAVHSFTVSEDALELIFKVMVDEGAKGVKCEDFQRLRIAVGVAREKSRDAERKKERLAREAELAQVKEELQKKLDAVSTAIEEAEKAVKETGKEAAMLPAKVKAMKAAEMREASAPVEALLKAGQEATAAAEAAIAGLGDGADVDAELRPWLISQTKKLKGRTSTWAAATEKASGTIGRVGTDAKKKDSVEVEKLSTQVLAMIRYHREAKGLKSTDLFDAFAKPGASEMQKSGFVAFFKTCEREPQAEGKPEVALPSDGDFERVFAYWDEDDKGTLSRELFSTMTRVYMKVVKDTVITDEFTIEKDSKSMRRLEVGEVVELLEGSVKGVKDEASEATRAKIRTMQDSLEGWATVKGNLGSCFLQEGGGYFKVVKETILTESFDIAAEKDATRKVRDTTRKLKPGELVDVREWPKKDEGTGLTRMRCRARSDGAMGWATTTGNTGIAFLQVA